MRGGVAKRGEERDGGNHVAFWMTVNEYDPQHHYLLRRGSRKGGLHEIRRHQWMALFYQMWDLGVMPWRRRPRNCRQLCTDS